MSTLKEMYKGIPNSPEATLTSDINASQTTITVSDANIIPEVPNILVIGGNTDNPETVKVTGKNGNTLTVERGFQGVPRSWEAGTIVARNFTEYDYNALKENIETLWENKAEISDIPTKVSQLENDKNYVTQEELGNAGYGDMVKSIYDKNDDGIVDVAETVIGNEIQLGSYKLVYNSTTNSLDVEVLA